MTGDFYDPVAHTYSIDGRDVPSVTQALKLAGRIDLRWLTPEAARRGTLVHAATVAVDRIDGRYPGRPSRRSDIRIDTGGDERVDGCLEAYVKFCLECRPTYRTVERGIFSRRLWMGGRPDRTLRRLLGYRYGVLELKTGTEQDWHEDQTAGYVELDPDRGGPRWVVYLGDDGRYRLRMCKDPDARGRFLSAAVKARKSYGIAA